jgi:hypothetical protein
VALGLVGVDGLVDSIVEVVIGPKTTMTSRAGRSRCARWGSGCRRRALPQEYENLGNDPVDDDVGVVGVDDLGGGQVAHTVLMMARSRHAHKRSSAPAPAPVAVDSPEWLPREVVPTTRPRTVLVSYGWADALMADAVVDVLRRAGHLVWIDRSSSGDGWGGRLLDTVWTCDVEVFIVSPAVAGSERVAREVHLAGAEHTPVVPVLLATTELPDDLAHYLDLRPPIDLRPDRAEGLRRLVDEVNTIPRKRVARPRRAIAAAVIVVTLVVAAWVGSRILLG